MNKDFVPSSEQQHGRVPLRPIACFYRLSFVVGVALILSLPACTVDITLSMDDKNPPTFTFKRNYSEVNNLLSFQVVELAPENQRISFTEENDQTNVTVWRIVALTGEAASLDKLQPITYGRIPSAFVQEIPKNGSPATLEEGKVYEATGPHMMMRRAIVRFVIRDGKAIQTPIPEIR